MQEYNRAALQTRACALSHQSYSGVAAAPAPAEPFEATDAPAAQPGKDHAALKHHSPLDTGMDEDGQAAQGDSDSPSAGSEEPDRRRPRGRGMPGEAQVGSGMWDLLGPPLCRAGSTRTGQAVQVPGLEQKMCDEVQAGGQQLSELLALMTSW